MRNTCSIKKHQWLAEQICDHCVMVALPVNGFLPSEVELSEKFKVNRLTVRRALQHLEIRRVISPVTGKRRRLLAALSNERATQLVACVGYAGVAQTESVFWNRVFAQMYECMALELQSHNINLVGVPITGETTRLPDVIHSPLMRAVLVFESLPADMLMNVNIPVISVFSDKLYYKFRADFEIAFDAFGLTARVVDRLVQMEHKRLVLVASGMSGEYVASARAGYEAALIRYGLKPMEWLVINKSQYVDIQWVQRHLLELLRRNPDIDGFILATNNLAPGFLEALTAAGVAVPQQVSVVVLGGEHNPDMCGRQVTGFYNDYPGLAGEICEYTRLVVDGQITKIRRIQLANALWVEGNTVCVRAAGKQE